MSMIRSAIFPIAFAAAMRAHGLDVYLEVYATDCNGDNGAVIATVQGGVPPYTYSWSNGSTDPEIYMLTPGMYSVTVMDSQGGTGIANCEVFQGGGPPTGAGLVQNLGYGSLTPCMSACDGGVRLYLPRQFGGYTISTSPNLNVVLSPSFLNGEGNVSMFQRYELLGACAGQSIDLSVSNACGTGSATFTVSAMHEPDVDALVTTGSCTGANNGSVSAQVTITSTPPFSEDPWNVRAVDAFGVEVEPAEDFLFLPGTYDVQCYDLHPGDWSLRFTNTTGEGSAQAECVIDVPFTIADLGAACATVSGTLHYETDLDCVQDGVEMAIPHQVLRATPGPIYGITTSTGAYSIALPYGSYALEQVNPDAVQLCPSAVPVAFAVSNGNNAVIDLADSMLTPFDLSAFVSQGISRVGFPFTFHVRLTNPTASTGENITVTMDHDPLFAFVSGSPGAVGAAGQVQWTLPALGPFEQRWLQATVQVPPNPALFGYVHAWSATATSTSNEPITWNNTYSGQGIVVASYDPNDKVGTTNASGSTTQYFLDQDEWIDYVIRFQNTGTDTAFTVVVRDEIELDLDIESLQILGASHAFEPSFGQGRELVFTFNDILLPDSTTDWLGSQGFVAFRMKPRAGLLPGELIENSAAIFFDFNEPVITEPSVLTAEFSTGTQEQAQGQEAVRLQPNPVNDALWISSSASIASLRVISADGREVMARGIQATNAEVNVSGLKAGAYLILATFEDGTEARERFIKQ